MKMGLIDSHIRLDQNSSCNVYSNPQPVSMHAGKLFDSTLSGNSVAIVPLSTSQPPTSQINEIVINSACQYSTFKVDSQ